MVGRAVEFVSRLYYVGLVLFVLLSLGGLFLLVYRVAWERGADATCLDECKYHHIGMEHGWHDYAEAPGCLCADVRLLERAP